MSQGASWVGSSLPYLTPRSNGQPEAWGAEAAARGRRGGQRIVAAGEVPADAEVAGLLGVREGEPVVVRRRIIELDEEPCELTDTYYPAEIARGTPLGRTGKIRGGAVTLLASLGHVGVRVQEEVTAHMPDPEQRTALRLAPDEPVLRLARTTWDADDRPIQADIMIMPAHRQRLRYELRIG
ncbi:GntR family transcriptional regulator [Streptomyces odontomachi]|uniref:GntR family transcriptional regulator n=1 Tax=Streptomyces odontomachi TaxID=2944940 RepID=UPI00210D377A|nr:UTRA domain-containing protein [Streptomyces sp. ODS25]